MCRATVDGRLALRDSISKLIACVPGDIDPDQAIVPVDDLSQQALEVQAEDLALEDTLYALQKAFQSGILDTPTYLRQVCSPNFPSVSLSDEPLVVTSGCLALVRPMLSTDILVLTGATAVCKTVCGPGFGSEGGRATARATAEGVSTSAARAA